MSHDFDFCCFELVELIQEMKSSLFVLSTGGSAGLLSHPMKHSIAEIDLFASIAAKNRRQRASSVQMRDLLADLPTSKT
jgi:hypothetical protein